MSLKLFGLFVLILLVSLAHGVRLNRGNEQRNALLIKRDSFEVKATVTRMSKPGEGKRVSSSFSALHFPEWRVQRTSNSSNVFKMRMGIISFVEYQESSSGVDGLDPTDTIVAEHVLWEKGFWSRLEEQNKTQDDVLSYHYQILPNKDSPLRGINLTTGISDMRGWITSKQQPFAPTSWKWRLVIDKFPWTSPDNSIALRTLVETEGDYNFRMDVPANQSDNPRVPQSDLIFSKSLEDKLQEESLEGRDQGFINWPHKGISIGGTPEMKSDLLNTSTFERSLRVVSSISPSSSDMLPLDPTFESLWRDPEYETFNREFVYFSFMVRGAVHIEWDSMIGLDEDDSVFGLDSTKSTANSFLSSSVIICILVTITML